MSGPSRAAFYNQGVFGHPFLCVLGFGCLLTQTQACGPCPLPVRLSCPAQPHLEFLYAFRF